MKVLLNLERPDAGTAEVCGLDTVDPYNFYIDRNSGDNLMQVK